MPCVCLSTFVKIAHELAISITHPLCLEPIEWRETSVLFEPPSAWTMAKRSPFGSHAKARMVVSLLNS
eukprot:2524771-Pleurochrysis_carterae.AAC.2